MDERCAKHQFEAAEDVCRTCGYDFCNECLVYSFGAGKPPYCLSCALAASGVRSTAGIAPLRTKREIKARHKEWHLARKSGSREGARVEVSAFDEFVSGAAPGEDTSLNWLDEHLGGSGERVPF